MDISLKRVSQFASECGITEPTLRWWIFNAETNGLAKAGAIVRINRSVFIRPERFAAWIDSQATQQAAA